MLAQNALRRDVETFIIIVVPTTENYDSAVTGSRSVFVFNVASLPLDAIDSPKVVCTTGGVSPIY